MKKWSFLIIVLLFCFNLNVKAANTCSSSEMARLKNLASHVEFTYDYEWELLYNDKISDIEYKWPNFTITATNLNKELKVMVEENYLQGNYKEFKDNGNGVGSLKNFSSSEKITITIRAYTNNACSGNVLTTKVVQLPSLNSHYYSNICKESLDFEYCAQFVDKKISDEEFNNAYSKWSNKNSNNNSTSQENIIDNNNSTQNIKIIVIIVIAIIIVVILIILIAKRRKNNL